MCRVQAPLITHGLAAPRLQQAPRAAGCTPRAAHSQVATQAPTQQQSSNIVSSRIGRRAELEREAKELLERDSRWHEAPGPANMVAATSPKHFKSLVTGAARGQLVVVDYFAPHCCGCRTLNPKLHQISANNGDCLFIKVNTESEEMRELALNLGVTKLPYFQIWRDSEIAASFTANVATVSVLRAEIAAQKACLDPLCGL